jgi:glyoxylase-like metal-dependent hydrolase (beta-lactamase superfamily II)
LAGPRRVLVEAGTGDKLDAKSRGLFAMEETSVEAALLAAGVEAGAVELAVVSHLHFDHAGGLTRRARAGETPDWVGPASSFGAARGDEPVKVTFPNAKVVVQKREWEDAVAGRSVMTRTYFADHVEPLSDRVALVDSPPPFAAGYVPGREELPGTPQGARETEIAPGLFVFRVPGHTWGQQAVRFEDEQGRTIVFTPDVIPTARHVGQAYSLAYDVEPYTSMVTRGWLLAEAAAKGWCLFLNHEPGEPLRRVVRSGAWFETPVT